MKLLTAENSDTGNQVTTYSYGTTLTDSGVARSDLLISEQYPDSSGGSDVVAYEYNRQGEVTKKTDQNENIHEYEFDKLGRMLKDKITTLGGDVDGFVQRLETAYNDRGLPSLVLSYNSPTGTAPGDVRNEVRYTYNDFGQLTKEEQKHDGVISSTAPEVLYDYEPGSADSGATVNNIRLKKVTYPNLKELDYGYGTSGSVDDKLSRVLNLTFASAEVVKYARLGIRGVVETDYTQPDVRNNLAFNNAIYNPADSLDYFGRVKQWQWEDYSGTPTAVVDLKHGYNTASDRLYRRNEVARSNSAKFDELYGYDGLSRLDDFDRGELNSTNTAITGSPTITQDWTLDPTGNWGNFQQGVVDILNQDRTHTKANEIDTITRITGLVWATPAHDASGNMTEIPKPTELDKNYLATWDAWNRLVKLETDEATPKTVAEYQYDASNRRIVKKTYNPPDTLTETRDFYYSARWQVLEEQVSDTAVEQFVWGIRYIDDLVLRDRTTTNPLEERLYALQDANWNVVAITNDSGAVQQRFAYDPYGGMTKLDPNFTTFTGTDPEWEYTYTSRRLDAETELMYYRARYYHTELGRFIGRDPIGYRGGMSLYQYVSSRPILYVDPTGLHQVLDLAVEFWDEDVFVDNLLGRIGTSQLTWCDRGQVMLGWTTDEKKEIGFFWGTAHLLATTVSEDFSCPKGRGKLLRLTARASTGSSKWINIVFITAGGAAGVYLGSPGGLHGSAIGAAGGILVGELAHMAYEWGVTDDAYVIAEAEVCCKECYRRDGEVLVKWRKPFKTKNTEIYSKNLSVGPQ